MILLGVCVSGIFHLILSILIKCVRVFDIICSQIFVYMKTAVFVFFFFFAWNSVNKHNIRNSGIYHARGFLFFSYWLIPFVFNNGDIVACLKIQTKIVCDTIWISKNPCGILKTGVTGVTGVTQTGTPYEVTHTSCDAFYRFNTDWGNIYCNSNWCYTLPTYNSAVTINQCSTCRRPTDCTGR